MKVPPVEKRSGVLSLRVAVSIVAVAAIPLLAFAAGPAWWSQRGVLSQDAGAEDYAPVNQGQLKNIARAAVEEMDIRLAAGAGDALHNLLNAWSVPTAQTNDYAPVNLGQLKNVAKPFYDRLIAAGLLNGYPWSSSSNLPNDFAIANIGQVKTLFNFDLVSLLQDSDGNGLPDAWEQRYFEQSGVDPNADPDADGATNLQEYERGTDPTHPDSMPSLRLSPAQLTIVISPGHTHVETLDLTNTTSAALPFQLTPDGNITAGLSFSDSDRQSGPNYQWEDISTTGTLLAEVSSADDGFEGFELPFAFPYFGTGYTTVFVSSNGYITFGEGAAQYDNYELPSQDMPANEIAGFHTDLNPGDVGDIYYLNEGTRTIIQFQNVARYDGNGNVTFQIVLESDGGIEVRYKDLPTVANDVTVGLQNGVRDKGLTIAYGQDYLHPNLALRILPDTAWFTVSPTSGLLGSAQAQAVIVALDATQLESGSYTGSIELALDSSAPVLALVPVTMIVNNAPTVSLSAPAAGSSVLSSGRLTLTAEASDPDGTISEVQFFADGQLLGETTSAPFSFVWSAPPAGSHLITANATDNFGTSTASSPVSISVVPDSDADTIPDQWELAHFGNLDQTADGDFDGDGTNNGEEYLSGTDPVDYFNGALPTIAVVAGDNQRGPAGEIVPIALTVRVTNEAGDPWPNAPVHFRVETGNGQIVLAPGGNGSSALLQTNQAGEAAVFCMAPQTRGSRSTITAECHVPNQNASVRFMVTAEAFLEAIPEGLAFVLNLPETQSKTVVLHNSGPAPLDFLCEPDAPYYRFEDSDAPGGPVYEWNDVNATGTLLASISQADDEYEALDLPFSFPFFGEAFSRLYVSSNGSLTVGAGSASPSHGFLPGNDMPPGAIAAFHTDLNPGAGGEIYYRHEASRTVIQFEQVQHYDGSGPVTFQIILEESGAITFLYKTMDGTLNNATVGVQNLLQDQAVEVACNQTYVRDGFAVRMTRERSWFGVAPASGELAPGESVEITGTADGTLLFEGNYAGLLRVRSAAEGSILEVPVTAVANVGPVVALVAPRQNAGVTVGQNINVEAQAQDRKGQIVRVEFYEGASLLGTVAQVPFALPWQPAHAGSFILTARAIDDGGATTISPPLLVQVEEDHDFDGLGDQWEIANFGNLNQTRDGDYDGDGRNNQQEYEERAPGNDFYDGKTPRPVFLSRTRAASKRKVGFRTFVETSPPRYYLQRDVVTRLLGGNPESAVGGTVTTKINPLTGEESETRAENPLPLHYGFMEWDPEPTATRRVDRLTKLFGAEENGGAYNDPPDEVDDHEAIVEGTTTLSDEYTTGQLIADTRAALPAIPAFDAPFSILDDATFADFEFMPWIEDQDGVYISHSNYQFKWHPSPNLPEQKKVTWIETFYPFDDPRTPAVEDTTPINTPRSWEGTANETPVYSLSPSRPGRYSITTLPAEPMLDGNRDGKMDFKDAVTYGADLTSPNKPYRFWLNDDQDNVRKPDPTTGRINVIEGETVPVERKDHEEGQIKTKRNLEDFSRLWIDLGHLQQDVLASSIQVGLKWKTIESGEPAISIYPSEDWKGSTNYLTDDNAAARQIAGVFNDAVRDKTSKQDIKDSTFVFKADYWNGVTAENSKKCLLFEGKSEGKGELAVVFLDKDGRELTTGSSVWLELKNVKKMYERAKAEPSSIPQPQESTTTPPRPSMNFVPDPFGHQWDYSPTSWTETKDYVVFVHGWNTTYERARDFFADTLFKRLWHKGYRGRMAALYWPTLVGLATYNESEYRAWHAGETLKEYVDSLPDDYTKHLAAHSMGNIVAGSALRHGLSVTNYALLNASVPASCYDDSSALHQPFGSRSPDHDLDEATQALAYKNKFATVDGNLVNFHLASDEALDAWQLNQEIFKPQAFYQFAGGDHAYKYFPGNPPGEKLFLTFILSPNRILQHLEESLAYAAKSSTLATGAEENTRGSISVSVNQANFGYEREHSAFWEFGLQNMNGAYERLMDELGLERTP